MIAINFQLAYYMVSWRGVRFVGFSVFAIRSTNQHPLAIPMAALVEFMWPHTIGWFLDVGARLFFPCFYPKKGHEEDGSGTVRDSRLTAKAAVERQLRAQKKEIKQQFRIQEKQKNELKARHSSSAAALKAQRFRDRVIADRLSRKILDYERPRSHFE
jgi:hypothetical protein